MKPTPPGAVVLAALVGRPATPSHRRPRPSAPHGKPPTGPSPRWWIAVVPAYR